MEFRRYGKFRLGDYGISWVAIVILLTFSISSFCLELSIVYVVIPLIYAMILGWTIYIPNREVFRINDNRIIVKRGRKEKEIVIPQELTVIVSKVDIGPPFAIRTVHEKQTHILKNKCAISILYDMPLKNVLERLHQNHMREYTTSTIKLSFEDYRYIYSFVCDQQMLIDIVHGKEGVIIIPESLSDKLYVENQNIKVYIDVGY